MLGQVGKGQATLRTSADGCVDRNDVWLQAFFLKIREKMDGQLPKAAAVTRMNCCTIPRLAGNMPVATKQAGNLSSASGHCVSQCYIGTN